MILAWLEPRPWHPGLEPGQDLVEVRGVVVTSAVDPAGQADNEAWGLSALVEPGDVGAWTGEVRCDAFGPDRRAWLPPEGAGLSEPEVRLAVGP